MVGIEEKKGKLSAQEIYEVVKVNKVTVKLRDCVTNLLGKDILNMIGILVYKSQTEPGNGKVAMRMLGHRYSADLLN